MFCSYAPHEDHWLCLQLLFQLDWQFWTTLGDAPSWVLMSSIIDTLNHFFWFLVCLAFLSSAQPSWIIFPTKSGVVTASRKSMIDGYGWITLVFRSPSVRLKTPVANNNECPIQTFNSIKASSCAWTIHPDQSNETLHVTKLVFLFDIFSLVSVLVIIWNFKVLVGVSTRILHHHHLGDYIQWCFAGIILCHSLYFRNMENCCFPPEFSLNWTHRQLCVTRTQVIVTSYYVCG